MIKFLPYYKGHTDIRSSSDNILLNRPNISAPCGKQILHSFKTSGRCCDCSDLKHWKEMAFCILQQCKCNNQATKPTTFYNLLIPLRTYANNRLFAFFNNANVTIRPQNLPLSTAFLFHYVLTQTTEFCIVSPVLF